MPLIRIGTTVVPLICIGTTVVPLIHIGTRVVPLIHIGTRVVLLVQCLQAPRSSTSSTLPLNIAPNITPRTLPPNFAPKNCPQTLPLKIAPNFIPKPLQAKQLNLNTLSGVSIQCPQTPPVQWPHSRPTEKLNPNTCRCLSTMLSSRPSPAPPVQKVARAVLYSGATYHRYTSYLLPQPLQYSAPKPLQYSAPKPLQYLIIMSGYLPG